MKTRPPKSTPTKTLFPYTTNYKKDHTYSVSASAHRSAIRIV
jgi:hypothetical protein